MDRLRIIIVEDEPATARNLQHMLQVLDESIQVTGTLGSVQDAISWFNSNPDLYDLIFMDIRLTDGMSFEVFKKTAISKPVIFVTAYNDYALTAFKNNGIDYILKPFDELEIATALQKFKNFSTPKNTVSGGSITEQVLLQLAALNRSYKKSFLIHYRDKLIPIETSKIHWFYTAHEVVYACTADHQHYVMDFTMEQLEQRTDPQQFFRANRQFIINRTAIIEVNFYFNGRLSVKVKPAPDGIILISKARVPEFKNWMNG